MFQEVIFVLCIYATLLPVIISTFMAYHYNHNNPAQQTFILLDENLDGQPALRGASDGGGGVGGCDQ